METERKPTDPAIVATGLRRSFGAVEALAGVDLLVPSGAFFALVGPNGAGKSTTVRILSGLIARDGGEARVLGLDPQRSGREVKRLIGVVPDFPALFDELSPRQNLRHFSNLRGLDPVQAAKRLDEIAGALALGPHLDQPCSALSHGTLKKAVLATAMIHAPPLLFLDEPFEGIDPVSARTIRRMLDQLRQRGVTVFLTSHVMPLVESVASHVAIIDAGGISFSGTLEEAMGTHSSLEEALLDKLGSEAPPPALEWYQP